MGLFDQSKPPEKKPKKLSPGDRVKWTIPQTQRKGIVREVHGATLFVKMKDGDYVMVARGSFEMQKQGKAMRPGRWGWYVKPEQAMRGVVRECQEGGRYLIDWDNGMGPTQLTREKLVRLKPV